MTYLKIDIEKKIDDYHDLAKITKLLSELKAIASRNDVWLYIRVNGEIKV